MVTMDHARVAQLAKSLECNDGYSFNCAILADYFSLAGEKSLRFRLHGLLEIFYSLFLIAFPVTILLYPLPTSLIGPLSLQPISAVKHESSQYSAAALSSTLSSSASATSNTANAILPSTDIRQGVLMNQMKVSINRSAIHWSQHNFNPAISADETKRSAASSSSSISAGIRGRMLLHRHRDSMGISGSPMFSGSEFVYHKTDGIAVTGDHSGARNVISNPLSDTFLPELTIFCAPKPYSSDKNQDPQRRALLSWLRNIVPPPKIVLVGSDPSFYTLEKEFPGRVKVEPDVDVNFYGVPLFHSLLARAQAADTELSMIINGDIILLNDLLPAIARIKSRFKDWVLTGARWDVKVDFPFRFETQGDLNLGEDKYSGIKWAKRNNEIRRFAHSHGVLHTGGGVDFWCWNNSPTPLFKGEMPPFAFGRGKYDNWFLHEMINAGQRHVVDATDAVTTIHVVHSYSHVNAEQSVVPGGFWSTRKKSSWELFANIHLAETHGTYTNQMGTAQHAAWRLASCREPEARNICLMRRLRPGVCKCEYSNYALETQTDPAENKHNRRVECGVISVDRKSEYIIPTRAHQKSVPGLPHTVPQLLSPQAGQLENKKAAVVVPVTADRIGLLMNFVCSLRKVAPERTLVVVALDEAAYRFVFLQGLPVVFQPIDDAEERNRTSMGECPLNSACGAKTVSAMLRSVVDVLKEGYDVIFSEADVIWATDPAVDLLSLGSKVISLMKENSRGAISGFPRFFFATKNAADVLERMLVKLGKGRLLGERAFEDVLCGMEGLEFKRGSCHGKRGLQIKTLDQKKYAHLDISGPFANSGEPIAKVCGNCLVIDVGNGTDHSEVEEIMRKKKTWMYSRSKRMCVYSWHRDIHM